MYPCYEKVASLKPQKYPAPVWLYVASIVVVVMSLVQLVVEPQLSRALALGVAIIFAVLLLRGSRIAWVGILIGAVGQPLEAMVDDSLGWRDPLNVLVVALLAAPTSWRFIWKRKHQRSSAVEPKSRWLDNVRNAQYVALAYFAGWDAEVKADQPLDSARYRSLFVRVGVCTGVLLVLVTITYNWQQSQPSSLINIIANVTWTLYAIFQVTLIGLGLFCLYQRRTNGRKRSTSQASGPGRADS